MREMIMDTVMDSVRLAPFLFVTYVFMEWLAHRTGRLAEGIVEKSGRFGPLIGAVLGIVPQCGFSAAAGGLYAGRVITLGTLFSIYLSTSDEMLPILFSEAAPVDLIGRIVVCKIVIGMGMGFLIDLLLRRSREEKEVTDSGEMHHHCHCSGEAGGHGVLLPAFYHTIQVTFFTFLVTFGLNLLLHVVGEEALSRLFLQYGIVGELAAGLLGMIPNCASSVMITQLYLEGVFTFGAMLSGLLTGSGIGLLVLFRVNHNWKENMGILAGLYITGTVCGMMVNAVGML